MIILLFISHCSHTAIQLSHGVLTRCRRYWESHTVLQSRVAWVKQYCCVLEKRKRENNTHTHTDTHHSTNPLSTSLIFCSSTDTNGINEGINYRGLNPAE